MLWFSFALLAPASLGLANVLDNYLTNRLFPNVWSMIFYSSMWNVVFLPLSFFLGFPGIPSLRLWPAILAIGAINVLYLYPYYQALQIEDTSVVSALFHLGGAFVPFLAFLLVREHLSPVQYAGFFIVLVSSIFLTIRLRDIRLNRSFWYMLSAGLLIALEVVIYKYLFGETDWSTGFFWSVLASFALALPFLLFRKSRAFIWSGAQRMKRGWRVFAGQEFLTFIGTVGYTYASSLQSVTVVQAVGSAQPFFVLGYAVLFRKFFPKVFREDTHPGVVVKKIVLFFVMLAGMVLAVE